MDILGLFLFILLVEGSSEMQCQNELIASGSDKGALSLEQKKYVAESFKNMSGRNNLLFEWNLPKEYPEECINYKIEYRLLGKRLKCSEVPRGSWSEKTGVTSSYKIENLLEFSKYEVSIGAKDKTNIQNDVIFFIIQNATFETLEADNLTKEDINIETFDVHKENIIVQLAKINCLEIFSEIEVIFKIFCEDPRCTEELVLDYKEPLENLTITLNATLTPSFYYNYTASIHRKSGDRLMRRKKFISSNKPSTPKISVLWNKNNTMVLFWNSTSSYSSDIMGFDITLQEEKIWNKTYYFRIKSGDICTTHNFSVSRTFSPSSLIIIKITAVDRNNTRNNPGIYSSSSYPPPVNWLNENVSYRSDNSTITVDVNMMKTAQKLSSKFLFILIKEAKPSIEDIKNVQELEQKLQTKFYENSEARIVGVINLTEEDILNLTYQIGNSTDQQKLNDVYYFSKIKYNNKKLRENCCYNITILPINEFREKCEFMKYFFNMCTEGVSNNSRERSGEDWRIPKSIWIIPLILSICVAIVIFLLYKISHSKNRWKILRISVSDMFSTSNVNTTMSNVDGQIGSTISLALNDYEEIQNEMGGTESIEKYFKKIETKNFEAYVERSLKTRELQTQHAMFAKGLVYPHEVGMSNENRMKNRYNNLIAYDHSRVKLNIKRETGCSDYINANYINDINDQKAYIATQGPLPQTTADFWRMIWQERVKSIVMLANIYEDGKKRVEKYWPDEREKKIYGNICIRFRSVELFADYEYRIFSVTCDGEVRQVYQIHFTSWPGHGVPLYPHALVPIIKRMQELTPSIDSPIVVHCSGGVGRTGIILLCAICVRMAQEKGVIDMVYTLNKLRKKRPNMVDNYEQYKLAHLVVLECLNTLSTEIKCDDRFKHSVNRLLQNKEDKLEFIYLKENQWRDEAMKSVASDTRNYTNYPEKNRIQSLVPENQERVCLSELPNQDESSTYINAVWVRGYRSPEKFIVTQQPLSSTLSEFWRLIVEKDIRIVVSLNKINSLDEDSWIFWPNEDQPEINPVDFLSVIFENMVQLTYFDVYSVKVLKDGKIKLRVKIYSLKNWESGIHIPPSCEGILSLLDTVESISHESRHILVTCWDGFRSSGIYVALSYIIQRMKMEEVCDVCLSVRRIRHSRKEFIANDVQYSFLYSAALCWMEKNT